MTRSYETEARDAKRILWAVLRTTGPVRLSSQLLHEVGDDDMVCIMREETIGGTEIVLHAEKSTRGGQP